MERIENREISSSEYQELIIPRPGFIAVEKDKVINKYGHIYLPKDSVDKRAPHTPTGIVVCKSPYLAESAYEQYLMDCIEIGDRVGFDNTVPLLSPCPPFWTPKNDEGDDDQTFLIHITDLVLPHLCLDKVSKIDQLNKIHELNEKFIEKVYH